MIPSRAWFSTHPATCTAPPSAAVPIPRGRRSRSNPRTGKEIRLRRFSEENTLGRIQPRTGLRKGCADRCLRGKIWGGANFVDSYTGDSLAGPPSHLLCVLSRGKRLLGSKKAAAF